MSLPLAVDSAHTIRKTSNIKKNKHIACSTSTDSTQTFEKPVGVTLFGAVGLEEGEDILGDVFHHPRGES